MSNNPNARSLTPFLFEGECLVRVITVADAPWFVATDVCKALGLANTSKAVEALDDDEKGLTSSYTPGGSQELLTISESGLYTLILRSRQATTPGSVQHRFRKWVTAEVLPAIRKTGRYEPTQAQVIDPGQPPEQVRDMALCLSLVRETRQDFGRKAAQQMWLKHTNLPTVPAMFEPQQQMTLFEYAASQQVTA